MAYAKWAGKMLPTEAQWEKAARGGDAHVKYPWGHAAPDGTQCNLADVSTGYNWVDTTIDDGYQYTAPVKSYRSNGYGLFDMAGNVWEWCRDEYINDFYAKSPTENPVAGDTTLTNIALVASTSRRVMRGGSWDDNIFYMRVADRSEGNSTLHGGSIGFRCVKPAMP